MKIKATKYFVTYAFKNGGLGRCEVELVGSIGGIADIELIEKQINTEEQRNIVIGWQKFEGHE